MINEIPATEWDFAVFITCGIKENVPNMAAVKPNISMLVINHSKKFCPYINLIYLLFSLSAGFYPE